MDNKNFDQFLKSKEFKYAASGFIGFVVLVVVFTAGMVFGMHRANFTDKFRRQVVMIGHGQAPLPQFPLINDTSMSMVNPYGAIGKITALQHNSLTVESHEGIDKIFLLSPQTLIRDGNNSVSQTDLSVGQAVVVIGLPDSQGEIDAHFIRIIKN